MVTLDDIAKEVGVSKVTVSNALRGKANVSKEMAARIMQVARTMHYRIGARSIAARNLKSSGAQSLGPIGIVVPAHSDAWTHDFIEIAVAALAQQQRQAVVQFIDVTAQFELDEFANQGVDGLIIAHPELPQPVLQQLIMHRPTVCIDQGAAQRDADAVLTDSERGIQNGIEYLVSSGKRKIAVVGRPIRTSHHPIPGSILPDNITTNQETPVSDATVSKNPDDNTVVDSTVTNSTAQSITTPADTRMHAALYTLHTLGLAHDESVIIPSIQTKQSASAAIQAFGDNIMQYDAIACLTDEAAIGVIHGLHMLHCRIPQDVAVLGFGGTSLGSYTNPELSTIDTHIDTVARTAVRLLLTRLNDEDAWMPTTITVPSAICIRHTTV